MAKKSGSILYKCSNCGYTQPRWLGRCPECNEWNTLEEIIIDKNNVSASGRGNEQVEKSKPLELKTVQAQENCRFSTGIEEFDRVLGGGAENVLQFYLVENQELENPHFYYKQHKELFLNTEKILKFYT